MKKQDRWLKDRLTELAKAEGGIESEARRLRNIIASGQYPPEVRQDALDYIKKHDAE